MMNRVELIGRLTRDPELRKTQNGTSVCSFTLAVDRRIKSPGQPDADFITCVAWNKTAENMTRYLHKGSLIAVEGRIQTRSYDNQQGQRVYVTEVVADSVQFLESRRQAEQNYGASQSYGNNGGYSQQNSYSSGYDNLPEFGGYSQPAPRNSYQAPASSAPESSGTPYASANNSNDISQAFGDSETFDIASDDLPF